ncbi:hypothetical protein, partial [Enterobacter kobei]|uniref:hypothetical protein n=1 Tax=Enterobacter kobei TaxID=208224 RepID=UPI002FD5EDFC
NNLFYIHSGFLQTSLEHSFCDMNIHEFTNTLTCKEQDQPLHKEQKHHNAIKITITSLGRTL